MTITDMLDSFLNLSSDSKSQKQQRETSALPAVRKLSVSRG